MSFACYLLYIFHIEGIFEKDTFWYITLPQYRRNRQLQRNSVHFLLFWKILQRLNINTLLIHKWKINNGIVQNQNHITHTTYGVWQFS